MAENSSLGTRYRRKGDWEPVETGQLNCDIQVKRKGQNEEVEE